MKILTKIISLLTVLTIIFSIFGCDCASEDESNGDSSVIEDADFGSDNLDVNYKYPDGTHEFYVKTADSYVVKNAESNYKIVVPKNADKHDGLGLAEFNTFFNQATGLTLPIVTDDAVSFTDDSEFICIGKVSFLESAGINDLSDLGLSGFIVKTKGKSVFITGKTYGTVYGVYEYLKWAFNYEYYVDDCYTINKNVKNLKFIDFNIKDVPDFQNRAKGWANVSSAEMQMRMRYTYESSLINVKNSKGEVLVHHTVFNFIEPDIYSSTRPEYFSEGLKQLSYTANGNEQYVREMQDIVFDKLTQIVTDNPNIAAVEFTHNDINTWSSYDLNYYEPTYGSAAAAASQIIFINPVAKRLQAWMDENFPGREFNIVLFAYVATIEAPVKTVDGKYVPIDEKVVLEPNVAIQYAPIEADYMRPIDHDNNAPLRVNTKKWAALTEKLYYWFYYTNFNSYFMPYDSFAIAQEFYQFAYENNGFRMFDQANYEGGRTSAWSMLKSYLHAQLMWNTHYNVNTIYKKFFNAFYGPASEKVFEIFNDFRMWSDVTKNFEQPIGGAGSCLSSNMLDAKYWPQEVLQRWIKMYDGAFDSISKLKETDAKAYTAYYRRIALESISPRYLLLNFYKSNLNSAEHDRILDGLIKDIDDLGVVQSAEHKAISNLRETL